MRSGVARPMFTRRLPLLLWLALAACAGEIDPTPIPDESEDALDTYGPPGADDDELASNLRLVPAVDDAFVRDGDFAQTTYGTDTRLRVDGDFNQSALRTALTFDVPPLPNVVRARLRLYVTNASKDAAEVFRSDDVRWSQASVTWATQPSPTGSSIATLSATEAGSVVAIDVTDVVRAGRVSLVIRTASTDGLAFVASEDPDVHRRPALLLELPSAPDDGGTDEGDDGGIDLAPDDAGTTDAGTTDAGLRPDAGPAKPDAGVLVPTDPNFKVAFIGDSATGKNFRAVLELVKREKAQAVMHNGDFGYAASAATFIGDINAVLGASFPYFASKGNHDTGDWTAYAKEFNRRWAAIPGVTLDSTNLTDEQWTLTYKGLHFVVVGQNGNNTAFAGFIKTKLAADKHLWRVCAWHKNQAAMQVGSKGDEMGWDVYENCRLGGAVVTTGHEHSYERTFSLSSMRSQTVDKRCHPETSLTARDRAKACIGPGRTVAIVSGLAGVGVRNQDRCAPFTYPYGCKNEWAMAYTSDQGATYGALFITFNVDGNPKKATGVFKTTAGKVIDTFTLWKD